MCRTSNTSLAAGTPRYKTSVVPTPLNVTPFPPVPPPLTPHFIMQLSPLLILTLGQMGSHTLPGASALA